MQCWLRIFADPIFCLMSPPAFSLLYAFTRAYSCKSRGTVFVGMYPQKASPHLANPKALNCKTVPADQFLNHRARIRNQNELTDKFPIILLLKTLRVFFFLFLLFFYKPHLEGDERGSFVWGWLGE